MNATSFRTIFCLILSINADSCIAHVNDFLKYLAPNTLKSLIKKYPLETTVFNEVIETYLSQEAEQNAIYGQPADRYHKALFGYGIGRNVLLYAYLSNKRENLMYGSISVLLHYGSNYLKNLSWLLYAWDYLVPTPMYGSQTSLGIVASLRFEAFGLFKYSANNASANFSLPIKLTTYGLNAYLCHTMLARDNSSWNNYLKNLSLAFAGYYGINLAAEYFYKTYKAIYYSYFASNIQLARRVLIEHILRNKNDMNNNHIKEKLQSYGLDKNELSKNEKQEILKSPYKRHGSFENYLNTTNSYEINGKNIFEKENQHRRLILAFLKNNSTD